MTEFKPLSRREWEVVDQLLQGKSNKLIALSLGISDRTVEFHLKNIYAKSQVSSRVELVLKLRSSPWQAGSEKLGTSTVAVSGHKTENRSVPDLQIGRGAPARNNVSITSQELQMKNLWNTGHVPTGLVTALITGSAWVALLNVATHMAAASIAPWILPILLILAVLGTSVGLVGKRRGQKPWKIALSTWFGTGFAAFAMTPLTVVVAVPLGKLAERLGLIDRAAMSSDVASALVIISMLVLWLIVGIALGSALLSITMKRPGKRDLRRPASEVSA